MKTLHRRHLLRGAGGIAIALPLLNAMLPRQARAAGRPKRLVIFSTANGTIMSSWRPTGSETAFTLSPILSPLEKHKKDLVVLDGIDLMGGGAGPAHAHGAYCHLTGVPCVADGSDNEWAGGPSVDQVIGRAVGGTTKFRTLELGIQPERGEAICFADAKRPIFADGNPASVFRRVFSEVTTGGAVMVDPALQALHRRRKSVLDAVGEEYASLKAELGGEDRRRLDVHLTTLRELETRLTAPTQGGASCSKPTLEAATDVPGIAKAQMDLTAMALACDLTRVVTLMWGGRTSQIQYKWLGVTERHHDLSHMSGPDADAKMTKINTWLAGQLAYLTDRLKMIDDGGTSVFDSSVILWTNDLSNGRAHSLPNAPYVLVGSAGGHWRTGRYLQYPGARTPHNNLLVSIINAMGLPATSFGKADWCTGPLERLA